jgi:hypothetical protein
MNLKYLGAEHDLLDAYRAACSAAPAKTDFILQHEFLRVLSDFVSFTAVPGLMSPVFNEPDSMGGPRKPGVGLHGDLARLTLASLNWERLQIPTQRKLRCVSHPAYLLAV